ncbi:carboxypeptidase-like regulatory domain-containing protein [Mucilaginibacter myungsuensis]|uniref:Carboxypeptidase-like regulatory domain-containing protein n=1 Tax=Mucilaginibacter myungsuensis TaxID=649104 RepID=A0A929L0Q9_9SPHI|nr:carboxypeptidase-like regulatory domain-containing protein [Mucilaginibacter myungsuensis]MBE9663443.1 carboxypeptidase-like regulatory domain-containing protein [Mucilaginibacter myungsuensis]MDN3600181.1 carboxypeptidase-like regulatory domain-containing protein [Mucilaginibacter myungsuensis]
MSIFRTLIIAACCFFTHSIAFSQTLSISGKVIDEQKLPMPSATVFLSGTKKITATDVDGKFSFHGLSAGAYIISVKMIGYTPYFQSVTIKQSPSGLVIQMNPNPTALREVNISGRDEEWPEKFALFKRSFLGITRNGLRCKILNPTVLQLRYLNNKNLLKASSDDFLIIENPELGYRIKFLLNSFEYDLNSQGTKFNGEKSFEEMTGSPQQQAKWQQNRFKAYYGSAMHFFRALYNGPQAPIKEGFLARGIMKWWEVRNEQLGQRLRLPAKADSLPIKFDTIVTVIDTSFIELRFKRDLIVHYDPQKSLLKKLSNSENARKGEVTFDHDEQSILTPPDSEDAFAEALIDRSGRIANNAKMVITGRWGSMRVGDQLPFDYQPDPPKK